MANSNQHPQPDRTPGDILREDYLDRFHITQRALAEQVGCDLKVVNNIVNGRSAVTADMALRLGAALDVDPRLFLAAQQALDLNKAEREIGKLPKPIKRSQLALPL